jgi:hypothetical protein
VSWQAGENEAARTDGNGSQLVCRVRPVIGYHCLVGKRPEDVRQCKRYEPKDLVLAERVGLDAGLYSYFGEALPLTRPSASGAAVIVSCMHP